MKKQTKKTIAYLATIIFSTAIIYVVLAYYWQIYPFARPSDLNVNQTKPQATQTVTTTQDDKQNNPVKTAEITPKTTEPNTNKAPIQNDGENPNSLNILTGHITNKTLTKDKLIIRVTIDQFIQGNGRCELVLKNKQTNTTITKQTVTIDNPSSATCQGFDITRNELSTGTWSIEIKIHADNKTGLINGQEVKL